MKLNNIQHVFFDLDHTLWDFDKNSALAFEKIFAEEEISICLEDFLAAYMPINEKYWKLYRENKITQQSLRTGRLQDCFKILKHTISPLLIHNLSTKYIEFLPSYNHLLEDTVEILEYLKPKYKLHIITNGFEQVQHHKLKNSRIENYFTTVTTSEEAGAKKPHSQIFKKAFFKSKALPVHSLMIGDNYEADIVGGLNAGMQTLYFDYYKKKVEHPTAQIQTLKELKAYL